MARSTPVRRPGRVSSGGVSDRVRGRAAQEQHRTSDGVALDLFQHLLQTQAPATFWTPVTDYSIEARREAEGQTPALIKSVFAPARVLDYGCGRGFLVAFLAELGVNVRGYDPQAAHREHVPPYVRTLVKFDRHYIGPEPHDLVICREVLEHVELRKVPALVHDLCRLSSKYVYLTTRFHPKPDHLLDVATSDELDPTHITLLNQDFLRLLFVLEGFVRRPEKETAMDWQGKGRVLVYERV